MRVVETDKARAGLIVQREAIAEAVRPVGGRRHLLDAFRGALRNVLRFCSHRKSPLEMTERPSEMNDINDIVDVLPLEQAHA
jgi:hypothetical protein